MGNTHDPRPRISGAARKRAVRYGAPITALALAAVLGTAQADAATSAVSHTPTAVGSIATVPAGARAAAAPSDSTKINVDIALEPRNAAELTEYATLVSDPNSVFYKQYLTKQQTRLLFAPSQSTVDAVGNALTAAGLKPGAAIDDDFYIPVSATIGQLKQAFKIGFAGYRLTDGRAAFNATAVPELDGSVAGDVRGIIGLDDFATPDTDIRTTGKSTRGTSASAAALSQSARSSGKSAVPAMCSAFTTAIDAYLKKNGYTGTDGGTYYSPTAMASAYGYAKQLNAGDRGQGVTVAVEEWEAVNHAAVSDYLSCVGSHSKVSYNTTAAGNALQPTATNGIGVEASLDIEAIASIAPKAEVLDYEGPDITASFTDADWLDTFAAPIAADNASVISLSWGGCEAGAIDKTLENSQTSTLQLAAVQGQSFFTSSDDNGSEGCNSATRQDATVSVDDPANSPWITAVGGTYMQGKTNPTVVPWNDSFNAGGATGGGVSIWQSLSGRADYQAGFVGAGYSNACGATNGSTCRQVPDISTLGDWRSGFPQMYYADSKGYDVLVDGGTSLAAPVMAAITALADSSTRCAIDGPAGFINPTIYDLAKNPATYAKDFQDETTGSNAYSPSGYTGKLYQATGGYDMASGLGSPRAATLIPALCAPNKYLGWIFGHSQLGAAAEHGQASIDKAISAEATETAPAVKESSH
ncbi:S53 family peptidase [Actinospica sp. MGRD01-02]|uniref:S53 family peptidase n=1 Tax=Actinospica acidithermotolerans TaxID=2828514 RepID=A0A941E9Z1_9ACTN|nr:S53 family peptidase [Actinospica acidithermotolerans]MBR7827706.1 S53 family peptidase [Actinospica acidithermotolerans]